MIVFRVIYQSELRMERWTLLDVCTCFIPFYANPNSHCFFFKELFLLLVCNLFLHNEIFDISVSILSIVVNRFKHEALKHVLITLVGDLNEDPGQLSKAEYLPVVVHTTHTQKQSAIVLLLIFINLTWQRV